MAARTSPRSARPRDMRPDLGGDLGPIERAIGAGRMPSVLGDGHQRGDLGDLMPGGLDVAPGSGCFRQGAWHEQARRARSSGPGPAWQPAAMWPRGCPGCPPGRARTAGLDDRLGGRADPPKEARTELRLSWQRSRGVRLGVGRSAVGLGPTRRGSRLAPGQAIPGVDRRTHSVITIQRIARTLAIVRPQHD